MFKISYTPETVFIGNRLYVLDRGGRSGLGEDFDDWLIASDKRMRELNISPEQLRELIESNEKQMNTAQNEGL